jgi:hypothetical protein
MVEEEPEYGDAQLMTWNPHVGRSPTGWDDYARRERERAQVGLQSQSQSLTVRIRPIAVRAERVR